MLFADAKVTVAELAAPVESESAWLGVAGLVIEFQKLFGVVFSTAAPAKLSLVVIKLPILTFQTGAAWAKVFARVRTASAAETRSLSL
jgi:hypothetical protein